MTLSSRSLFYVTFFQDLRLDPATIRAALVPGGLLLEPGDRLLRRLRRRLSEMVARTGLWHGDDHACHLVQLGDLLCDALHPPLHQRVLVSRKDAS